MSKTTKRKHVTKEALDEYYIPEGEEEIVKIVAGKGNNLHEVESSDGKRFLVSMPTKFRKNLWIKRGDFVIISPIKEGNKVQAEIVYVLYNKQIKYLEQQNLWPKSFSDEGHLVESQENQRREEHCQSSEDDEDDDLLFKNLNRREFEFVQDSESSSSEDEGSHDEVEDEDVVKQDIKEVDDLKKFNELKIS
eukprot:gene20045-22012_t